MAECGIHEECSTLKMKVLRLFETQVTVYQSKRLNVPDDSHLQQYRCGNFEFCTPRLFVRLILPNVIRDIVCRLTMVITLHPLQLLSNSVFFFFKLRSSIKREVHYVLLPVDERVREIPGSVMIIGCYLQSDN